MNQKSEYTGALSRKFGEGGYTFLKRALQTHFATKQPIVINSGGNYLSYRYVKGQKTFMEGTILLEGDDAESMKLFKEVADTYDVERGLNELQG